MQKSTNGANWSKTSSAISRHSDASQLVTKRPIPALLDSLVWSRFSMPAGDCKQALALQLLFYGLLNPWATMIRRSWTRAASIEETLALWAASLREIKKRIRPLFRQERVATNAGLFLEGLLGDEQRKTGWMRAEAAGDPGPHGLGCGCPARYRTRLCHRAFGG